MRYFEGILEQSSRAQFEQTVLVHLGAAYNLARWLTRDDRDAEDVVQEACLRAFRFLTRAASADRKRLRRP